MDSFYPSVELLRNPKLKGLPVIVGADPKGGEGRGVVTSCSYEARSFGVRSGQPISAAYRKCPQAVFLPPDFKLYLEISDSVMIVLRRFADKFEQVSIDEAFIDATERVKEFESSLTLAKHIKDEVKRTTGLSCSIGIAPNKSAAKIASEMNKPNGLTEVRPEQMKTFLDPLPVIKIPGVGKKSELILARMGIKTIGQLASYPAKKLTETFGKNAVWLWGVAKGLEEDEVRERTDSKSIASESTFERDEANREAVRTLTEKLTKEVHERVISDHYMFRTVGIKIRFEGFETHTHERSLSSHTDQLSALIDTAQALLREFDSDTRRVRLIGVKVSNLIKAEARQTTLSMFSAP
jgi:DNA polymerase IV (DinB-like DNA polymerase)